MKSRKIPTIFVMNLRNHRHRRTFMEKQFRSLGLTDYHIISAAKPGIVEIAELKKVGLVSKKPIVGHNRHEFTPGEIGHYMTVAVIMIKAFEEKPRSFILMEDDAVLPPNFVSRVKSVMHALPSNWDMVSFSWAKDRQNHGDSISKELIIPAHYSSYRRRGIRLGTESLLINGSAISKILDHMWPMFLQTDKYLDMLKNSGLLTLLVVKSPITYQNKSFESSIQVRKKH